MARFFSREEYEGLLRSCGFERVRGEDLTLGIASLVCGDKAR
jgi:hypothetical protein